MQLNIRRELPLQFYLQGGCLRVRLCKLDQFTKLKAFTDKGIQYMCFQI